jgi:hypothetical protein
MQSEIKGVRNLFSKRMDKTKIIKIKHLSSAFIARNRIIIREIALLESEIKPQWLTQKENHIKKSQLSNKKMKMNKTM